MWSVDAEAPAHAETVCHNCSSMHPAPHHTSKGVHDCMVSEVNTGIRICTCAYCSVLQGAEPYLRLLSVSGPFSTHGEQQMINIVREVPP